MRHTSDPAQGIRCIVRSRLPNRVFYLLQYIIHTPRKHPINNACRGISAKFHYGVRGNTIPVIEFEFTHHGINTAPATPTNIIYAKRHDGAFSFINIMS